MSSHYLGKIAELFRVRPDPVDRLAHEHTIEDPKRIDRRKPDARVAVAVAISSYDRFASEISI